MTDMFDRLMWAYRAVFKQTDGGGGLIRIRVIASERTMFLFGLFGQDDYAADRTVTGYIRDADSNIIGTILYPTPADNERIPIFQFNDMDAVISKQTLDMRGVIVLGRGEQLVWDWAAMAQNEEVTFAIRALLGPLGARPLIATTDSGGVVTTTVDYNKVI